jgi:integrase
MIVVLWRGGLPIHEALTLGEHDIDPRRGSLLVRNGKGGKRREVLAGFVPSERLAGTAGDARIRGRAGAVSRKGSLSGPRVVLLG